MIHYSISYQNPHRHFIDISLNFQPNKSEDKVFLQLPSWRPGRYELADFSKNIQKLSAFDQNNNEFEVFKINKDRWCLDLQNVQTDNITIKYNFYANQLDAGSTYLDENQLYVNPVNCCLYVEGKESDECNIELKIPNDYKIACGLNQTKNVLFAKNYDQLAESPFIASSTLKHAHYSCNNHTFHLWFQGDTNSNFKKIVDDFKSFTIEQLNNFDSFPVSDYHFLFQLTPYKSYHGVEHTNSTVILLGSDKNTLVDRYEDLLGICSHELYHTWNIKAIRPSEMLPYDYTKENYSKLGYVAEGVTTYMGDLMLVRSKVFNWNQFVKTQNENLKRHYENDGRFNLSVADSSFDTWLDGYTLGIPNRKTSIYTEGALNMLMIDLSIIHHSEAKYSLHTVMNDLYIHFAKKNIGYTEKDFIDLCAKYGGSDVLNVINDHIYDTKDYTKSLEKCLNYVGIKLEKTPNPNLSARFFGFICLELNNKLIVKKVQNNSLIENNGVAVEDELMKIDDKKVTSKNIQQLLENKEKVKLTFKNRFSKFSITVPTNGNFYSIYKMIKNNDATKEQMQLQSTWLNN
ncbi:MAG: M61 family metallopeptidase [Flavobacteriales bacterium]